MLYKNVSKCEMTVKGQVIKPGETVEIDGPFNVLGFEKAKGSSKKNNEEGGE